ncbi:type II secretion system minor pseudopilin GspI [Indioceanicola profundi]|uniref:type II secretion system minor pseudopilin GspI n=1 Tax=Indioceanicola profundi TaxID=2220096 RepID=UPI000E6AABAC|nr:type II secretion system minor pseudopilin GspI [Indioceanicola profundi]
MRRGEVGFTLTEVLVALVVFSIGAVALLNVHGENIRAAAHVEERLLAGIVAENMLVETMTGPSRPPGTASGAVELAGRDWDWTRIIAVTPDPDMLRVDISVRAAGREQVLAVLTGFRGL